jgi:hypothetical protein
MDTESGFILPGRMRTNVGFGTCATFRCTKIVFLALTFHMCSVFALVNINYVKQSTKHVKMHGKQAKMALFSFSRISRE